MPLVTAEQTGVSLEDAKQTQAELQRLLVQTEMQEHTDCARVSPASARLPHAETEDRLGGS